MTPVITWAEDDLPMHVKGSAEWAIYRDPKFNVYEVLDDNGKGMAVELINNQWFLLNVKKGEGYQTCENWEITDLK